MADDQSMVRSGSRGASILGGGSRCPVCGMPLDDAPWRCERCDTPHHADCASYFGGCAIFACRDSAPPAALEVASWPAAARNLARLGTIQRVKRGALLSFCTLGAAVILVFLVDIPLPLLVPYWLVGGLLFTLYGIGIGGLCLLGVDWVFYNLVAEQIGHIPMDTATTALARVRQALPHRLPPSRLSTLITGRSVFGLCWLLVVLETLFVCLQWMGAAAVILIVGTLVVSGLVGLAKIYDGQQDLDFLTRSFDHAVNSAAVLQAKPGLPGTSKKC